jgi:O-methyltransferase
MTAVDLYLDLLAKALTRALYEDNDEILGIQNSPGHLQWLHRLAAIAAPVLRRFRLEVAIKHPYDPEARRLGRDWPARGETMTGLERLANARRCIEQVLADGVPGDIIETGVWRGGMSIFMRGVLVAHGAGDRTVWLADSFLGLPPPNADKYPADDGLHLEQHDILAQGVDVVRHNFERYGLFDPERVRFLVGWFKDTLPTAPMSDLAILRLDGDRYESTIQALAPLYPKLRPGGFCIVDDYTGFEACRAAVHDYRREHGIADEIIDIDGSGVYWRKR